jgi:hypothetical protein
LGEGTSMLPNEVTVLLNGFAADIVPTVLALVSILIPVALTLFGISFGVKKGIQFIQNRANRTL